MSALKRSEWQKTRAALHIERPEDVVRLVTGFLSEHTLLPSS